MSDYNFKVGDEVQHRLTGVRMIITAVRPGPNGDKIATCERVEADGSRTPEDFYCYLIQHSEVEFECLEAILHGEKSVLGERVVDLFFKYKTQFVRGVRARPRPGVVDGLYFDVGQHLLLHDLTYEEGEEQVMRLTPRGAAFLRYLQRKRLQRR